MPESSPRQKGEQGRPRLGAADVFTALRLPLAALFVLVSHPAWRLAILAVAAASDLLDGFLARRLGPSGLGAVLDPIADKLFMACAFGVVAFSGRLAVYEVIAVLLRDIAATVAFVVTALLHRALAIPARAGGKAVTLAQVLTLVAFLADSTLLRPLAWATGAIGLYAIWDYARVSAAEQRAVGE